MPGGSVLFVLRRHDYIALHRAAGWFRDIGEERERERGVVDGLRATIAELEEGRRADRVRSDEVTGRAYRLMAEIWQTASRANRECEVLEEEKTRLEGERARVYGLLVESCGEVARARRNCGALEEVVRGERVRREVEEALNKVNGKVIEGLEGENEKLRRELEVTRAEVKALREEREKGKRAGENGKKPEKAGELEDEGAEKKVEPEAEEMEEMEPTDHTKRTIKRSKSQAFKRFFTTIRK